MFHKGRLSILLELDQSMVGRMSCRCQTPQLMVLLVAVVGLLAVVVQQGLIDGFSR
jgi:hypothetical protein